MRRVFFTASPSGTELKRKAGSILSMSRDRISTDIPRGLLLFHFLSRLCCGLVDRVRIFFSK